jgi:hypothetical protein
LIEVAHALIRHGQLSPRSLARLRLKHALQLLVESQRRTEELFAQIAELRCLQEHVFAGPSVISLDGVAGQRESRLGLRAGRVLALVGGEEFEVVARQLAVGPGLDRCDRTQAEECHHSHRRGGDQPGAVAAYPPAGPRGQRLAPGGDRLVSRPPLHVVGQGVA